MAYADKLIEELRRTRKPVIDECEGCNRILEDHQNTDEQGKVTEEVRACDPYWNPANQFQNGRTCPMATHIKLTLGDDEGKTRVGQQKLKKRKNR